MSSKEKVKGKKQNLVNHSKNLTPGQNLNSKGDGRFSVRNPDATSDATWAGFLGEGDPEKTRGYLLSWRIIFLAALIRIPVPILRICKTGTIR
jgi:hypothetical protein